METYSFYSLRLPGSLPVASPHFLDCKVELDVKGKEDAIVSLGPLISTGFQEIIIKLIMSLDLSWNKQLLGSLDRIFYFHAVQKWPKKPLK